MPRSAPRADEVGRHERLPVSRRQRVGRAPEGRDQERERRGRRARGRAARSAPRTRRARAPASRRPTIGGRRPAASPSSTVAAARETSSGERSRSFGYARSTSLSLVSGTSDRSTRAPSRAESVTSRQPSRPGSARSTKLQLLPARGGLVDDVEPQRLQAARTCPRGHPTLDDAQRRPPAVDRQLELARQASRIARASAPRRRAGRSGSRRGRARSGRRSSPRRPRSPRSG